MFEDLAVLVNGANGSRATVYIRSVAAYKHTTLVCAMLANNTYNLPVAFISGRFRACGGSNRGNKSMRHGHQVVQSLSKTHIMYGVENTTRVRNIVLRFLW